MKKTFYLLLSLSTITLFIFYWLIVFATSLPPDFINKKVTQRFPHFSTIFTSRWKLFTPMRTSQDRLYFIVRKINQPGKADTLEVLEQISKKKQKAAPFNQKETIIDYCVYNNVTGLTAIVWNSKEKPKAVSSDLANSQMIENAVAAVTHLKTYQAYLRTLENYCRVVLKEKNIDQSGLEMKMMIKEKQIPPLDAINDPSFKPAETIVFETPYQPL